MTRTHWTFEQRGSRWSRPSRRELLPWVAAPAHTSAQIVLPTEVRSTIGLAEGRRLEDVRLPAQAELYAHDAAFGWPWGSSPAAARGRAARSRACDEHYRRGPRRDLVGRRSLAARSPHPRARAGGVRRATRTSRPPGLPADLTRRSGRLRRPPPGPERRPESSWRSDAHRPRSNDTFESQRDLARPRHQQVRDPLRAPRGSPVAGEVVRTRPPTVIVVAHVRAPRPRTPPRQRACGPGTARTASRRPRRGGAGGSPSHTRRARGR
jgi:hypothetical protein